MPSIIAQNWINVRPGDPAFVVATNVCDYFELGNRGGDDYWLEGLIVTGEFLFNGRLYLPDRRVSGVIIDNFPKGPIPHGWTRRQHLDEEGYDLVSDDGTILFGYHVQGVLCMVTVNIYAKDGGLVAESRPEDFHLHRHPATIGRGGIRFE